MLKAGGYAQIVDPARPLVERDTCACGHCTGIIFVKPGSATTVFLVPNRVDPSQWEEVPGAFCRCCMKPVCLRCHQHGRCTPWEKQFEKVEARGRLLRSIGL